MSNDAHDKVLLVSKVVGALFGLSSRAIRLKPAGVNNDELWHAQRLTWYLSHVWGCVPLSALSSIVKRDRKTIAKGVHAIEDMRDHGPFDNKLDTLERALTDLQGFDPIKYLK